MTGKMFYDEECLVDGVAGWRVVPRIIKLAHSMGFESDAVEREWHDDYSDDEWSNLEEIAEEAIEWLTENRCGDGYVVAWVGGGVYVCELDDHWQV